MLALVRAVFQNSGYGQFNLNGKPTTASRALWIIQHGELPREIDVCHTCDNRLCCNPNHLFTGTRSDNMQDAKAKGRMSSGKKHGLSVAPENRTLGVKNGQAKLTDEEVRTIRSLLNQNLSHRTIAKRFGVSRRLIGGIGDGSRWAHIK